MWEAGSRIGGNASTLQLDDGTVMNDAAYGGTYSSFHNSLAWLKVLGWKPHDIEIPVVFSALPTSTGGAGSGGGQGG